MLDNFFDPADAERIFWVGEFTQIFPKPGKEDKIYEAIRKRLPSTAKIYRRSKLPKRFHLANSKRLAPLIVVPQTGTVVTNKERYARAEREGNLDKVRGGHGYDNRDPLMRATFIADGSKFKKGFTSKPFESVDVYNLMSKILDINAAPNDGKWSRIRKVLK